MKVMTNDGHSRLYLVMEWVEGQLLRHVLNEKKTLPPERAVRIALRILDALDYIHRHGVVHRDLKPENIMIDTQDRIKLIDFGIAASAGLRRLTFTKLSQTLGTPDYISPEQVKGKRCDARSDLYAMGVMLYEMHTGKVPFTGPNAFVIMNDRLLNNPVPPREIDPQITTRPRTSGTLPQGSPSRRLGRIEQWCDSQRLGVENKDLSCESQTTGWRSREAVEPGEGVFQSS